MELKPLFFFKLFFAYVIYTLGNGLFWANLCIMVGKKTSETNTKDFFGKKNDPKSSHYETLASPNLGNKL
jgi:hypothetical protein